MENSSANPILVFLICMARCLVPLAIMLAITFLLKRLGLVSPTPQPPPGWDNGNNNNQANSNKEGGLANG